MYSHIVVEPCNTNLLLMRHVPKLRDNGMVVLVILHERNTMSGRSILFIAG